LEYLRFNQDNLRSEVYRGIVDAAVYEMDLSNVGNMSILPSSLKGGPWVMRQHYQDAIVIVRNRGKTDLFITMTCDLLAFSVLEGGIARITLMSD
jgi:hypothetical protein